MKKGFLGIICAMVLLTGCSKSPKLSNGEEVIASVEGKNFTANELYDSMKKQYGTSVLINMIDTYIADKEIGDSEDADVYADSLISQYKLQYEQSGMNFNDALINAGYENEEAFKKILISDYKMSEVSKKYLKEQVTDSDIEKYYKDKISAEINVKHILIIPDVAEGTSDEAKSEAEVAAYNKAVDLINIHGFVRQLVIFYLIFWAVFRFVPQKVSDNNKSFIVCGAVFAVSIAIYFLKISGWATESFGFIYGILLARYKDKFEAFAKHFPIAKLSWHNSFIEISP